MVMMSYGSPQHARTFYFIHTENTDGYVIQLHSNMFLSIYGKYLNMHQTQL